MNHRIIATHEVLSTNVDKQFLESRGFSVEIMDSLTVSQKGQDGSSLLLHEEKARQLRRQGTLGAFARKVDADRVLSVGNSSTFSFKIAMGGALGELTQSKETELFQREIICHFLSGIHQVAANDPRTKALLDLAAKVASSDVTAMIVGGTGTGKEVIARYVHRHSKRADKPFIAVNCAAVPDMMLEAMLFGYEKGAFTGAYQSSKGIFRAADGGTLLLDEISEMPLGLQAKLLRVLQEREVTPLGGTETLPIDVRVIATSNRDMAAESRQGRFREDLYYRLNVFPLYTLPLHKRVQDIYPITAALIMQHTARMDVTPGIADEAMHNLVKHHWPGNVRELENVLQRALVLSEGNIIKAEHLMIDPEETHTSDTADYSMASSVA
jgi:two-component system response regulator FlrC